MDLINFDDELVRQSQSSPMMAPLIPDGSLELSPDYSNPIEAADQLVKNANDPFECLDLITTLDMIHLSSKDDLNLRDGSSFSFECFSNTSQSHNDSNMTTSTTSSRKSVSRCHSDTSTINSKAQSTANIDFVNRSAESVNLNAASRQQQQLLKLSFFNSPNSPINSSNYKDSTMAERISQEARKISRQFAVSTDSSFEDLNNVSQSLIDNSTDSINDDFRDMKVDLKDIKVEPTDTNPQSDTMISDKIAIFQKQLKRIKKEQETIDVDAYEQVRVKVEEPSPIKIPDSPSPPKTVPTVKKEKLEMDGMLKNLTSLLAAGKNEEAKRQLGKLSEMLASQQEPKTIQVQPMVREGTFEIDKKTGKRVYVNGQRPQQPLKAKSTSNAENLLEKIQSMIAADASSQLEVVHGNVQLMDSLSAASPIVVLVQKDMSTPMKYPRLPSMAGGGHKPTSVVRALEGNRKTTTATPARATSNSAQPSSTMPRNSLTTPRPSAVGVGQGKLHPYDQRLSQQKGAGNVRKSLMSTMDKSPKDKSSKSSQKSASSAATRPASVRRSVSMKASVQINTNSGSGATKPTSTVRPSMISAKKIADAVSLGRPSSVMTPFKPSSAIKARSASSRVGGDASKTLMRPKKPSFDHGSLV